MANFLFESATADGAAAENSRQQANVQPTVGLMTLEKFAEAVGLPPGVVLGHLNRGILPTVTLGRRRLINVVALQRELARKEFAL